MNILENKSKDTLDIINSFVDLVEREAECNIIKTRKLEGSHYAAMKRIQKLLNDKFKA